MGQTTDVNSMKFFLTVSSNERPNCNKTTTTNDDDDHDEYQHNSNKNNNKNPLFW